MIPKVPNGLWTVPRLWPDGECFILGGGPSLKTLDVEKLRGRRVIAVNNAYKLANWFDVVFYGDRHWLRAQGNGLLDFAGLKVTTQEQHIKMPGIHVVKRKNAIEGISRNPAILAWNKSSGACAIGLAAHFGVKRIVLLGFDMRIVDGKKNFHDDYPKVVCKQPYNRFRSVFPAIARDLKAMHIECVNATPGSALEEFPVVSPEEVLC